MSIATGEGFLYLGRPYRLSLVADQEAPLLLKAPITYTGTDLLQADIDNFKAALQGQTYEEAFLPALGPTYGGKNRYYPTQEEYDIAVAEAMNVEYRAIVDAGFVVQIDDPALPSYWDAYTRP